MAMARWPTGLDATSTSLLRLLAIEAWPQRWARHELAKQVGRSLHRFRPRVPHVWLRASPSSSGRPRTELGRWSWYG